MEIRTTSYLMPSIPLSGTSARWLLNLSIDIRVGNNVETHVSHPTSLCSVAFNRSWSVLFDLVCGLWKNRHDRVLMEPHPEGIYAYTIAERRPKTRRSKTVYPPCETSYLVLNTASFSSTRKT